MITKKLLLGDGFSEPEKQICDDVLDKLVKEKESGRVGYYDLPVSQDKIIDKIYKFILSSTSLLGGKIEHLVVIGIGGSSLGTKAVDTMLSHLKNRNQIALHFLENCDPINVDATLKKINFKKTIFIMVSKSGGTIETTSVAKYLISRYDMDFSKKKIKKRFLIVTDEGSPLDKFAELHGLNSFHIPVNVGGRFSVLTAVGLLPLAILGYDIKKILAGANRLRRDFFNKKEPSLIHKAYFYTKNAATYPINVLFSYSNSFSAFNAWYVQLWAESLGKLDSKGSSVGLTPVCLVGSIDQHSFLQLIIQGPQNKTVTFIKVKNFKLHTKIPAVTLENLEKTNFINGEELHTLLNAQCDCTLEAVNEQKVPVDLIEIDALNEDSVGYMIYYFELLTSCAGVFFDINAYDQPGVESGKVKLAEKFKK